MLVIRSAATLDTRNLNLDRATMASGTVITQGVCSVAAGFAVKKITQDSRAGAVKCVTFALLLCCRLLPVWVWLSLLVRPAVYVFSVLSAPSVTG